MNDDIFWLLLLVGDDDDPDGGGADTPETDTPEFIPTQGQVTP
jgi:hypothetical protein